MKTTAILAVVGVVAVLAVAGLAVASSTNAGIFATQPRDGGYSGGHMGMGSGHMYEWQNEYSYSDNPGSCPMYEWDHNYSYDNDYDCPCM